MDIENEIERYYLAEWLLDMALVTENEYLTIRAQIEAWLEAPRDCTHPPLTKAGRHNKNYPCSICMDYYQDLSVKADLLHYGWHQAWAALAAFEDNLGVVE